MEAEKNIEEIVIGGWRKGYLTYELAQKKKSNTLVCGKGGR